MIYKIHHNVNAAQIAQIARQPGTNGPANNSGPLFGQSIDAPGTSQAVSGGKNASALSADAMLALISTQEQPGQTSQDAASPQAEQDTSALLPPPDKFHDKSDAPTGSDAISLMEKTKTSFSGAEDSSSRPDQSVSDADSDQDSSKNPLKKANVQFTVQQNVPVLQRLDSPDTVRTVNVST